MHGGAPGSGAPVGNSNAFKHGWFTRDIIEQRRYIRRLLAASDEFLTKLK